MGDRWIAAIHKMTMCGVLFLLSAGCTCSRQSPEVRIGISPWPGYEPVFIAASNGYFAKHGLNVEIKEFSSLSDTVTAFQRGQINAMCSTPLEALAVWRESGVAPKLISVMDYSDGPDVLIAGPAVKSLADLRGKSIAVEAGGLGTYLLVRGLSMGGLSINDVTVIPTDQTAVDKVLQSGKADAAVTYPPYSLKLLNRGGMRVVFSSKDIPEEIIDVVSVQSKVMQDDPEFRAKFISAWQDSLDYIKTNPDAAIAMMAKREGESAQAFKETLGGLRLVSKDEQAAFYGAEGKLKDILIRMNSVSEGGHKTEQRVFEAGLFIP